MFLSIIFTSRDDHYNGDNVGRIQISLDSLHRVLDKYFEWELILVDYNQVPGFPLSNKITDHRVKHVVITNQKHVSIIDQHIANGAVLIENGKSFSTKQWHNIPLLPLVAVNEGSKHATGDFILCTSTDNIFSYRLRGVLSNLNQKYLYRARLVTILENVARRNIKKIVRDRDVEGNVLSNKSNRRNNLLKSMGDFMLMHKNIWKELGGYLSMPHPLPWKPENMMFYYGSLCDFTICMTNYVFKNIYTRATWKNKVDKLNYVVSNNSFSYNHLEQCSDEYLVRFDNWCLSQKFGNEDKTVKYDCPNKKNELKRYKTIINNLRSICCWE